MSRNKQAAPAAQPTDSTTQPRPRDAAGRELDEWSLPRNGPARAAALAKLGRRDPALHPEDWQSPGGDVSTSEEE